MQKKAYTIPPKEREEWKLIILGQLSHSFQNFVLQLKGNELNKKIIQGTLSLEQAIDDLYTLCEKYTLAVQRDFKQIFKEW